MRHCCSFEPMDEWFIKDDERFSQRKLSFGICPICSKPIAVLIQFDDTCKCFTSVKKIGITAQNFVKSMKGLMYNSLSKMNAAKFKPVTYKWVYGINKQVKDKVKQYAKDFFGSTVLVKEI